MLNPSPALLAIALCGLTHAHPVPPLDSKGDVYKSEGENDPLIYDDAVGLKKVLMLYLDFADAGMEVDTRERGEQVLGGDTFEQLFGKQSYGKLRFDIKHVHGWRRLPGEAGDYSSKTTDSHREFFLQVFKLYPEVDFRDYDYIVANAPRLGNTAFGERDDLAIPYRNTRIKVAMNLSSPSPYVLAHEVGHLMGLPDLYTYGGVEGPKNPAGPWDLMSLAGRSTGFLGWHRHKLKWLDADRKTFLTGTDTTLTLTPLHAEDGVSMIVIPVDDATNPSKVFVVEVAQARRLKAGGTTAPGGVLVYSVDATRPTGENPVIVYPKDTLDEAPFLPGDRFEHEDAPFILEVLDRKENGADRVRIRFPR
jgi:M6 family metalloprotease-like protein